MVNTFTDKASKLHTIMITWVFLSSHWILFWYNLSVCLVKEHTACGAEIAIQVVGSVWVSLVNNMVIIVSVIGGVLPS